MAAGQAARHIADWPEESREAAQLVLDAYGEPDEAGESQLVWHDVGPWKRMVATRTFYRHDFPVPHIDAVESVIAGAGRQGFGAGGLRRQRRGRADRR